jgi:hypothetical protein
MTLGKLAEKLDSGNPVRASGASEKRGSTMSLHPENIGVVPEETARVAKASIPFGKSLYTLTRCSGYNF